MTEEKTTMGAWFDLNRQMCQDLIDARRWAAAWKAEAKMLRAKSEGWFLQAKVAKEDLIPRLERAEAELAKFKARRCETCRHRKGLRCELLDYSLVHDDDHCSWWGQR